MDIRAAILLVLLATTACNPTGHVAREDRVTIGGLFPLSGFAAVAGEPAKHGFLMALNESNASVNYVIEDYNSDRKETVTAAKKLLDVNDADVIVGPVWNEFMKAAAPVAEQEQTVMFSPWMTGEQQWVNSSYVYSATPSERDRIQLTVQAMKDRNTTTIAVIHADNAWANGYVDILLEELHKTDMNVTTVVSTPMNSKDYTTDLVKMGDVDAIYAVMAIGSNQLVVSQQMAELGMHPQQYIPYSNAETKVLQSDQAMMDGAIYAAPKKTEEQGQFEQRFAERYGHKPKAISAAGAYDATTLILQAIDNGARTREEIHSYLTRLDSYDGYSGTTTLNALGMPDEEEVILKQIQNGTTVEIPK